MELSCRGLNEPVGRRRERVERLHNKNFRSEVMVW